MPVKFYEHVPGWFDFQDIYSEVINTAQENDILVEVGSFLGKSTCYMLEEIEKSRKKLQFYCIDNWNLEKDDQFHIDAEMPWGELYIDFIKRLGKHAFYDFFIHNIKFCPGGNNLTKTIQSYSWDAAKEFENNSCYFVFIDAGHSYESVRQDLKAWYPKVKNNGIFAGHDLISKDIQRALIEFGRENNINSILQRNASWFLKKKNN
jgi:hypothetical protein